MSKKLTVLRKTEIARPSGFRARIEIYGPNGPIPVDDPQTFATKEQAQARENELAEQWKSDHAPDDAELEFA